MTHECKQEDTLQRIEDKLDGLIISVNGNGKFGICHLVRINQFLIGVMFVLVFVGIFHAPISSVITAITKVI